MPRLILFNKPFQVLSQFSRPEGSEKQTLADYLQIPDVYPAGRLDYDSEGLLLLTDNGILQNRIAHPDQKTFKTYWVQVEGVPNESSLDKLRSGLNLKDGPTKPAKAKVIAEPEIWPRVPPIRERQNIPTTWLQIEICEGRNRQVRRMTAAINHPTLRLIRSGIGDWSLDNLQPGEYREIQVATPSPSTSQPRTSGKPKRSATKRSAGTDRSRDKAFRQKPNSGNIPRHKKR